MSTSPESAIARVKDLVIFGAGGLGREIACLVADINAASPQWNVIGFYDDGKQKGSIVDDLPVLGGVTEINHYRETLNLVIAVSDPALKKKLVDAIDNPAIAYPVLLHPLCHRGSMKYNQFGRGSIVTAGVLLTTHIHLGEFVLLNLATTVGHDVRIGDYSSVMPGCSISGNVEIGAMCTVGTGARIIQNISIGSGTIVGAGAVVTKDFGDKAKLIGVPATNANN